MPQGLMEKHMLEQTFLHQAFSGELTAAAERETETVMP